MGSDDTTVTQCRAQEFEIWLLKKRFGGTLWITGVRDDDIELVSALFEELKAIADVCLDGWVLQMEASDMDEMCDWKAICWE